MGPVTPHGHGDMRRRRKKAPQPPIDPQRHPTGVRTLWSGAVLALFGGAMALCGPWGEYDVFGDGSTRMVAWRLTEAVTKDGEDSPATQSE